MDTRDFSIDTIEEIYDIMSESERNTLVCSANGEIIE